MNQSVSTSIHLLILSAVIIVEILIQAYYYAELSFISNLKSSITYSLVSQYVKDLLATVTITLTITIVENIGVEPMTSCMPCKRSSQLS